MRRLLVSLVGLCLLALPSSAWGGPDRTPHKGAASAQPTAPPPRLGVHVLAITPELRAHLGAPRDRGVLVGRIDPARSGLGLAVGDVILEVAGRAVATYADVRAALAGRAAGDVVEVRLVRDRTEQTVRVELGAGPSASEVLRGLWRLVPFGPLHERAHAERAPGASGSG